MKRRRRCKDIGAKSSKTGDGGRVMGGLLEVVNKRATTEPDG